MKTIQATMTGRFYNDGPTTQPDDVIAVCSFLELRETEPGMPRSTLSLALTQDEAAALRYNKIYNITLQEAG